MLAALAKPRRIKENHRRRRRGASRVWLPGQYYDVESGLSQNVNRDYEAATGRYVQSDPIGLGGGPSTYAYTLSNPLGYVDPTGTTVSCDQYSCTVDAHSVLEAVVDDTYVMGVYVGRLVQNAMHNQASNPSDTQTQAPTDSSTCPPPPPKDPCKGIAKQLGDHRQKLFNYMSDPLASDDGRLASAPLWKQEKMYQGRISKLVTDIKSFENELAKCRAQNGEG